MTKNEFTDWIEGLELQTLTDDLKEEIIEYALNLEEDEE